MTIWELRFTIEIGSSFKDGGPIGAFTTSGPRMGVRGPWRDRQPLPEEEARAAEAWKKVEAARPVAR